MRSRVLHFVANVGWCALGDEPTTHDFSACGRSDLWAAQVEISPSAILCRSCRAQRGEAIDDYDEHSHAQLEEWRRNEALQDAPRYTARASSEEFTDPTPFLPASHEPEQDDVEFSLALSWSLPYRDEPPGWVDRIRAELWLLACGFLPRRTLWMTEPHRVIAWALLVAALARRSRHSEAA